MGQEPHEGQQGEVKSLRHHYTLRTDQLENSFAYKDLGVLVNKEIYMSHQSTNAGKKKPKKTTKQKKPSNKMVFINVYKYLMGGNREPDSC